jgi:hypothetical protein
VSASDSVVTPPPVTNQVMDGKVKRDHLGRYLIPDPITGEQRAWTRATTWAKTMSDTYMLHLWQLRQLAKGLTLRPDILAQVMIEDDKGELDKLCALAMDAAGIKVGANLGKVVHTLTERMDRGEKLNPVPPILVHSLQSYSDAMKRHTMTMLDDMVEKTIICPELGVSGTFDRIMKALGPVGPWDTDDYFINDVKTAANIGYSWLEISIQLAIYAHGAYIWNWDTESFEDMPVVDLRYALVTHVPIPEVAEDGYTDLYQIDIQAGWEYAKLCELIRESRKNRSLAVRIGEPIDGHRTPPIPVVRPVAPVDWRARIDAATTRADLSAIWQEATARGEWSPELEVYGLNRARDIKG